MSSTATSKGGIPIRLPDERWAHITDEHKELTGMLSDVLKAVEEPLVIVQGGAGELLAVRELHLGKYMVVVYREQENDGFVITAFLTHRIGSLTRRKQLWP